MDALYIKLGKYFKLFHEKFKFKDFGFSTTFKIQDFVCRITSNSMMFQEKKNAINSGLGGDKLADYDSTWISHHDDFADLLKALNENKKSVNAEGKDAEDAEGKAKALSIELNSKSLKRRIQ